MLLAGVIFVLYAAVSAAVSGAVAPAIHLLSLVAAFLIGFCVEIDRGVWRVAAWLGVILLPLQFWFEINPNYIGCAMVLLLSGCLAWRDWFPMPWLFAGLIYSQSRGAVIAFGLMCAMWLWKRAPVVGFCLVAAAVLIFLNADRGPSSMWQRAGIWQDTMTGMTVWGNGWGTFAQWYADLPRQTNYGGNAAHVYNDALELIFELGVGAAALWVFIVLAWEAEAPEQKLILFTFAALGLTYFPLFIPVLGQLAAFTLGSLSAMRQSELRRWGIQLQP